MERIGLLNSVGFVWNKLDHDWEMSYNQLVEYKEANGNCKVSRSDAANKELGTWVNTQRTQYKNLMRGESSHMTAERIVKLNEIEFEWEVRKGSA